MAIWYGGNAMRARQKNIPDLVYAYPKEGVRGWADNLAIPSKAPNVDNAKRFMNFMMDPENIAIEANFAGFGNSIIGSDKFLKKELLTAPEMNVPEGSPVKFYRNCSPAAERTRTQLWTRILN